MASTPHAHPHALPGSAHAPAGMLLPGLAPTEAHRPEQGLRAFLDVAGGVAFAVVIGICCMKLGVQVFHGAGWAPIIAWESVWLIAAMLASPLLPSGIRHDISWRSTLQGLKLDWPELAFALYTLGTFVTWIGGINLHWGPIAYALAVGTAEEFIFRVLLLGWLVTRLSAPTALAVSSAVFGLAHLNEVSILGVVSVIPQTAGGFVLGAVYLRTRNPIGPILGHAFWDYPFFMAMGAGVSGGGTQGGMMTIAQLIPWLGFIVYGLWLVRHGVPLAGRVDPVGCSCGDGCRVHREVRTA